jgi:hypothetical protein
MEESAAASGALALGSGRVPGARGKVPGTSLGISRGAS